MLSTYCQQCGSKNEYRFTKPKFCSNCGESLTGDKDESLAARKVKPEPKKMETDFDEEGTDVYEVPEISQFEYEIEMPDHSFSLGSLFKNVETDSRKVPAKKKRGRPRKNGKT
jgi:hypothetical protein